MPAAALAVIGRGRAEAPGRGQLAGSRPAYLAREVALSETTCLAYSAAPMRAPALDAPWVSERLRRPRCLGMRTVRELPDDRDVTTARTRVTFLDRGPGWSRRWLGSDNGPSTGERGKPCLSYTAATRRLTPARGHTRDGAKPRPDWGFGWHGVEATQGLWSGLARFGDYTEPSKSRCPDDHGARGGCNEGTLGSRCSSRRMHVRPH